MTNTSLNNSKEATHDTFVWAKSMGEVPGKEMERWGLTVDTWGGFSWQGKTDLVSYEDTLDAPAYQDILESSLLPAAKRKDGNYNKTKRLATRQSPRRLGWRGMRLRCWKWPTKGDDINPIENLWAILDERLESKKFTTEEGMKKQSSNCGMKLICPSYITSLIPFQTVCEELGKPKEAQ